MDETIIIGMFPADAHLPSFSSLDSSIFSLPPPSLPLSLPRTASEDHRLRALGVVHPSDLPEEPFGVDVLEILAQSGYSGLSSAELDQEMKRRGLGGTRGASAAAFLVDRFVGRGHVRKMARLVQNPPPTSGTKRGGEGGKEGGNKRVLFSRLTRYHGPVGGELVERARTGDEVVDAARATLYAEQGKNIAQTICDHFTVSKTGAAASAAGVAGGGREEGLVMAKVAREVRVGLDDVARLMRMDGPTARAFVRAMQYREFDDRSALRVWWVEEVEEEERGREEEQEEEEEEEEEEVEGTAKGGRKGGERGGERLLHYLDIGWWSLVHPLLVGRGRQTAVVR